ncbi:MAG TPA: ribose-5-phosphate isomerase RpiA [Myxococcota bacterium]|nr:ribose-5-phosphate isomerase RpiA [Myxococcota bacterium]
MAAGERALEFIEQGQTVGLGTGRAASAFIELLGERVKAGLRLRAVPTSERSALLARKLGIPLVSLAEAGTLDVCVDGADEVDPQLDLIKGYGGALVREKIVAASARKLVILVGPEKLVQRLGARGQLPVEVVPFGLSLATRRLRALGCEPKLRMDGGAPYFTDNGNHILDCGIRPLEDAARFESELKAIPGLVGSGLFLGMADVVIVEDDEGGVEVRRRRAT